MTEAPEGSMFSRSVSVYLIIPTQFSFQKRNALLVRQNAITVLDRPLKVNAVEWIFLSNAVYRFQQTTFFLYFLIQSHPCQVVNGTSDGNYVDEPQLLFPVFNFFCRSLIHKLRARYMLIIDQISHRHERGSMMFSESDVYIL